MVQRSVQDDTHVPMSVYQVLHVDSHIVHSLNKFARIYTGHEIMHMHNEAKVLFSPPPLNSPSLQKTDLFIPDVCSKEEAASASPSSTHRAAFGRNSKMFITQ